MSCKKTTSESTGKADSIKIIDSINAITKKINDSILTQNHFKNWEGEHVLLHDKIDGKGKIEFSNIDKDEYKVKGELRSTKNYLIIDGIVYIRSEKSFSFEGIIEQSIQEYDQGKVDIRNGKKTFFTKDSGKNYRLYESINGLGFSDHIDIKY